MKHLFAILLFGILAALSAREPTIQLKEKQIDRKGVKLLRKSWKVDFHYASLTFQNTVNPDGTLSTKAWDDLFLGISHGTVNNGSWDGWNFLTAQGVKSKSLPGAAPASKVDFIRYSDSASLHLNWQTGQIRVYQAANSSKWLYVKVVIPEGIRTVMLRVRPGGAHYNIKGRERMIRYNNTDHRSVNGKLNPISVVNGMDGMAFFSRNYNEKYGNFLIFESAKTAKITHHSENPIYVIFHAKPGVKEMNFALSYFAGEDAENAISRFMVEQLPTAKKAMDAIQWDKTPDFTEFTRNAAQVQYLISGLPETKKNAFAKELADIRKAYNNAKSQNNVSAYTDALKRLRDLQKKVGSFAMNLMK